MSHERIDRERAGWVSPKHRPKGPTGRPLCRWCEGEIPAGSGRRTFCSDACVHEHRVRTDPGYCRAKVFERDHGVCAVCGFDTETLRGLIHERAQQIGRGTWTAKCQVLGELGIPTHRTTYWDADHIVPVVEGGGSCGLENYRTLCVPCHQRATAELAARRASERRLAGERERGIVRLDLEGGAS